MLDGPAGTRPAHARRSLFTCRRHIDLQLVTSALCPRWGHALASLTAVRRPLVPDAPPRPAASVRTVLWRASVRRGRSALPRHLQPLPWPRHAPLWRPRTP